MFIIQLMLYEDMKKRHKENAKILKEQKDQQVKEQAALAALTIYHKSCVPKNEMHKAFLLQIKNVNAMRTSINTSCIAQR